MNGLVLSERPVADGNQKSRRQPPPRGTTIPTSQGHRARLSEDEERDRRIRLAMHNDHSNTLDIFAGSPPKENRRPTVRRNSDTSVIDVKRGDRRRRREREGGRERERKEDTEKDKDGNSKVKAKKNRQVDTIDKLDVTGLYGVGLFHHDGPFDACNPHRNRKGHQTAPMKAFAEGSLNNALGGSGPVRKNLDLNLIHGWDAEGFTDYNTTQAMITEQNRAPRRADQHRAPRRAAPQPPMESTTLGSTNVEPENIVNLRRGGEVHGEETAGLGTSTFLEGTPAPRSALQRRESESDALPTATTGGLARKKSLAQKFRVISRPRQNSNPTGVVNYDGRQADTGRTFAHAPPQYAQSAGGRARMNDTTPFFPEVPPKTVQTQVKAVDPGQDAMYSLRRTRTGSSPPPRTSSRRTTNENMPPPPPQGDQKPSGGLLTRVKSLKGGRRARTNDNAAEGYD